ncbi:hypothetical protein BAME_24810 [Bacillus sp. M 2-6]|nr:hypothetical protein BAME_24810 [Bacillus sp. M 2-6]KIL26228.1 hypothetical protein B4133_2804 [Bacillus altitudinis]
MSVYTLLKKECFLSYAWQKGSMLTAYLYEGRFWQVTQK